MARPRFFFSAGEPSGDLHAANLIAAIRARQPQAEFFGLGGPKMAAAGCELLRDMTQHGSHMSLVDPLLQIGDYLQLIGRVDRQLQYRRPDVCVFIDYPGLNFVLASRGRVRRIPTMWYIPPQLWAWASFRVHKMARRLTRVADVFPFTIDFYRRHGVDAQFVGHPLADHFAGTVLDQAVIERVRSRGPDDQVVLFLPGSRRREIEGLLPRFIEIGRLLRQKLPRLRFVVGCLNEEHVQLVREPLRAAADLGVEVFAGATNELMSVADLALVSSGTATLELAWFGTPMVVLYDVGWLQYQLLARWLVTTPFMALPNAMAGRRVVPEYCFYWGGPDQQTIAAEALDLLTNPTRNAQMRADLAEVRRSLGQPGASDRAAEVALGLVGQKIPPLPWYRFGLRV